MQYTDEGVPYFVDHNTQRTTWHDPRRDGADPVYATALRKRKPYASTPLLPLLSMCELTDSLSLSRSLWGRRAAGEATAPDAGAAAGRPARVTLADVAAGAGAPMPSFWQQNRLELSLLAALAAVAVGLVAIMVAVYDDELERFMRKLGRVLRREVAERPLLARYLL
jgi:hypothetical protein